MCPLQLELHDGLFSDSSTVDASQESASQSKMGPPQFFAAAPHAGAQVPHSPAVPAPAHVSGLVHSSHG